MGNKWNFCPVCGSTLHEREEESYIRPVCLEEGCGFVHYNNPTPVAVILVQHGDNVLLARNRTWPEKMFSLITGFVEEGEDPAETAVRETTEELGLKASGAPTLIGIYPFVPFNQLLLCYHLEAEGEVELGEELVEFKSVPIKKLKGWPFGPGLAVSDWLKQRSR
jgi:NADH pyrophosphatase NudC (nudix superfamily)